MGEARRLYILNGGTAAPSKEAADAYCKGARPARARYVSLLLLLLLLLVEKRGKR